MALIGISGKIGVGKDTVGEIIQKFCATNNGPNFEIKKYAGKLKEIACILTGCTLEQLENQEFKKLQIGLDWGMTYRELLQKLGTEAMRNGLHENVWVNALFADYKAVGWESEDISNWIITDMRFPNEFDAVKSKDGITIRVERPLHALSQENHFGILHPSETSLNNAEFDYTIVNDSTIEELTKKVKEILEKEKTQDLKKEERQRILDERKEAAAAKKKKQMKKEQLN